MDEIDPSYWDLTPGAVLIAASGHTLQLVSAEGTVFVWPDQGPFCGVGYTEQSMGSILESRFHPLTLVEEPDEKLVEFVPDHAGYICEGQRFLLRAMHNHHSRRFGACAELAQGVAHG